MRRELLINVHSRARVKELSLRILLENEERAKVLNCNGCHFSRDFLLMFAFRPIVKQTRKYCTTATKITKTSLFLSLFD